MPRQTKIVCTEATWNPVTGCTKISPGCRNCYAERMSKRLAGRYGYDRNDPFQVTYHANRLDQPTRWRKKTMIFVCSMGDLFHEAVSNEIISKLFEVMRACPDHTFQLLTKRDERLGRIQDVIGSWPENVWAGVTLESADYIGRLKNLRKVPAAVRYLCCEPLLGSLGAISLKGINWVIAGGETGWGARNLEKKWVTDLRDQCVAQHTAFFFKQWGGPPKRSNRKGQNGCRINGKRWHQYPISVQGIS